MSKNQVYHPGGHAQRRQGCSARAWLSKGAACTNAQVARRAHGGGRGSKHASMGNAWNVINQGGNMHARPPCESRVGKHLRPHASSPGCPRCLLQNGLGEKHPTGARPCFQIPSHWHRRGGRRSPSVAWKAASPPCRSCSCSCPPKYIKSRLERKSNSSSDQNIIRLQVPFLVQMSILGRLKTSHSKSQKSRSGPVWNTRRVRQEFEEGRRAGTRLAARALRAASACRQSSCPEVLPFPRRQPC